MKTYRVRDWNTLYENNRSRELKSLDWVPIPNKHDGERYSAIWQEADGPDLFAAWILIVQVASKCGNPAAGCGSRGTLTRNNGEPHTPQSLALITRAPPRIFISALEYFANCQWLEFSETESHNPAPSCGNPAPACGKVPIEQKGIERNRIETYIPPLAEKCVIQIRIDSLFHRRSSTPWGKSELRAFKANAVPIEATSPDDWSLLEWFYRLPPEGTYRRKDAATLMNNWNAELDRARAHKAKVIPAPKEAFLTPQAAVKGYSQPVSEQGLKEWAED